MSRCKSLLRRHYGSKLKGLILYGSTADGQADPGSDIDILVLLASPVDYLAELRVIVDLLYPVQLESDRLISAKPAVASEYERGSIALYRNAERQGLSL